MNPLIDFDPATHTYWVRGVVYPSVTTILKARGAYAEYDTVDPAVLAAAGLRGDAVHGAIEDYVGSGEWPVDIDDEIAPYIDGFEYWLKHSGFEIDWSEKRTFSDRLQVAGTIDLGGRLRGRRSIVDVKTTRVLNLEAVGLQTAAYRLMEYEHEPGEIDRYALHLKRTGKPAFKKLTNPLDEIRFVGLARAYHREV